MKRTVGQAVPIAMSALSQGLAPLAAHLPRVSVCELSDRRCKVQAGALSHASPELLLLLLLLLLLAVKGGSEEESVRAELPARHAHVLPPSQPHFLRA